MAKKKEEQLSYLQMPLPSGRKYSKATKRSWGEMNCSQTIDTGALSKERNMSSLEAPYLVPSQRMVEYTEFYAGHLGKYYTNPISIAGFEDFLLVVYREGTQVKVDYIKYDAEAEEDKISICTGVLKEDASPNGDDDYPRCIVAFNVYDTPTDPVTGKYIKKLLIYPDCKSMDFDISEKNFDIDDMNAEVRTYYNDKDPYLPVYDSSVTDKEAKKLYWKNTYNQDVYRWVEDEDDPKNSAWKVSVPPGGPGIKYATVHASRVFGVDDERVYASGFNDYANWTLDDVSAYNESNAWCSPAQSNTKAGGAFTGITNFQGHVVCFKRDFMHEIYNTKNPFRLQDVFSEGAVDNRTIQDVDGKLIFVSYDAVKIYTGSNPRIISHVLNVDEYVSAVSGTDGRCYYLYCEDRNGKRRLFSYDTYTGYWSEQHADSEIIGFAHNKNGMYALCADGFIYKLDTKDYEQEWSFETDLITNSTVDIKHIKKIQMLIDIPEYVGEASNASAGLDLYILYGDETFSNKNSHLVYSSPPDRSSGKIPIRVKPRNKNNASYGIKLHAEGYGYVRIYELELFIESGGDMYV